MITVTVEVEVNGAMYGWHEEIPTSLGVSKEDPYSYNLAKQALSKATLSIMRSLEAHSNYPVNAKVNPNAEKRNSESSPS